MELATRITDMIDVEVFRPSAMPFIVLLAVNLSVGIALEIIL